MSTIHSQQSSPKKSPDCQRFFGYGKKIPKDVKRHCGMCRQHGLTMETRGHVCAFKNCTCDKCVLVRERRNIMSTQIRLRREQDKKFQRTTDVAEADVLPWSADDANKEAATKTKEEINMCYFCQKCKNHGVLMWKKEHKKNCAYAECRCEQCDLIDTRRALDRHIKSNRANRLAVPSSSSEQSSSSSPREESASLTCSSSPSSSNSQPERCLPDIKPPTINLPTTTSLFETGFPFGLPPAGLLPYMVPSPMAASMFPFSSFPFPVSPLGFPFFPRPELPIRSEPLTPLSPSFLCAQLELQSLLQAIDKRVPVSSSL